MAKKTWCSDDMHNVPRLMRFNNANMITMGKNAQIQKHKDVISVTEINIHNPKSGGIIETLKIVSELLKLLGAFVKLIALL